MASIRPYRRLGLLGAVPVLLAAGCSAAKANSPQTTQHAPVHPQMTPGMIMPDGTTMPAAAAAAAAAGSAPSASVAMICSAEIRNDVARILSLHAPARTTATWANHVYTCTYHVAQGPLVLSVTESGTAAAARAYFAGMQQRASNAKPLRGLEGLGLPAYETPDGTVAFVKDDKTLHVDASRLGAPRRASLAYAVATDVLGCWKEK